ncbi:histidine kinase dimerization/phosphoacceptor domain -containing protein [Marispirochaeta aestuarii]|uniref:sensor histidine kinase n=1 Tax=Marispirochaeta aestuarii TaxID=1963862 RepID=UPI0029C9402F|nr:histidine kinase dimerization/phosphoacceptor domain -containing protein [Marispirochaeta aestuarii]
MKHLSIEEYPEGILILDTSTLQIRNGNARAAELFGIDKERISEFRLPELLPEAAPLIFGGEAASMIHELPDEIGTRVLEISLAPREKDRTSSRPLFLREITSHCAIRRELEKELERHRLLDQETHHRVKNSLAIVSSLIGLKSVDLENPGELFHLASQVDAIAAIHHELAKKPGSLRINICSYLSTVVQNALRAYGFQQLLPEMNIENQDVPAKTATSLGIIVNEIIINACKYGFKSGTLSEARVWLELSTISRTDGTEIILRIGNNGTFHKGDSPAGDSSGTGMALINSLLQEMNARLTVTKEPHPIFEIRLTLTGK